MQDIVMNNEPIKKEVNMECLAGCKHCQQWVNRHSIKKCSMLDCHLPICRQCAVYIDKKAFCPTCVTRMVKDDVTLIHLKPVQERKHKYPKGI
jgi:hypothetical protein